MREKLANMLEERGEIKIAQAIREGKNGDKLFKAVYKIFLSLIAEEESHKLQSIDTYTKKIERKLFGLTGSVKDEIQLVARVKKHPKLQPLLNDYLQLVDLKEEFLDGEYTLKDENDSELAETILITLGFRDKGKRL